MRLTKRKDVVAAVENAVGSVLPDGVRAGLIAHGEIWIQTRCCPERPVRLAIAPVPVGEVLFADDRNSALRDLEDWFEDSPGWALTERSYLVAHLGRGDYILLSPDKAGVARRVVFADSALRELHLTGEDVDALIVSAPEVLVAG